MQRKYSLFLEDIIKAINKINLYVKNMDFKDFSNDEKSIDAVTRNFEIIGEAIVNIPEKIKKEYTEIPWREIKDMRNSVIHQYWRVDLEIEWEIIQNRLGILKKQIENILEKSKND